MASQAGTRGHVRRNESGRACVLPYRMASRVPTRGFLCLADARGAGGAPPEMVRGTRTRVRVCSARRSEEHTSELQSLTNLVCRLLLEKKNHNDRINAGPQLIQWATG